MVIFLSSLPRSGKLRRALLDFDARCRFATNATILDQFDMLPDIWKTYEMPTPDNLIRVDFVHKRKIPRLITHPRLNQFPRNFIRQSSDD